MYGIFKVGQIGARKSCLESKMLAKTDSVDLVIKGTARRRSCSVTEIEPDIHS